jgi:exosortase
VASSEAMNSKAVRGEHKGSNTNAMMLVVAAVSTLLYWNVFAWLIGVWTANHGYSLGIFVLPLAAYVLWMSRGVIQPQTEWTRLDLGIGLLLVTLGISMRLAGIYGRSASVEGWSLIPFLLGLICLAFGCRPMQRALPGAAFLALTIPLPDALVGQLSGLLQSSAAQAGAFLLQTTGFPAVAWGNVITLSNGKIGVEEACSGLPMVYAFSALCVGASQVVDRSAFEKIIIAFSAIPIAIAANWLRIFSTGLAFECFDSNTAKHFFHDVAGWLVLPVGFLLLLGCLAIMDRLILPPDNDEADRTTFAKRV